MSNFVLKMYQILTRNFSKIFLLKLLYKAQVSNMVHFQDEITHLFFLQNEALSSESINSKVNSINYDFVKKVNDIIIYAS